MTLVGTYMLYRPPARVHAGFPRSDLMSSVALGRALSTVRLFSTGEGCTGSTLPEDFGSPKSGASTLFWSSLSVRLSLVILTMGQSCLQFIPCFGDISP